VANAADKAGRRPFSTSQSAAAATPENLGALIADGKFADSSRAAKPFAAVDLVAQNSTRPNPTGTAAASLLIGPSGARPGAAPRGFGEPIISGDPGIDSFVDGVFVQRAQGSLLMASDTARVEVRRGPAGTLAGRNTIGGAVNFVTQKPTFDFGGNASLRVGNFDLLQTKLALNVPLIPERLATRIGVSTSYREGFSKNRFVGGDSTAGKERALAGRIQMLWNVSDNLELLWSADASYEPRVLSSAKCKFVGFGAARRSGTPGEFSGGRRGGSISSTSGMRVPTSLAELKTLTDLSRQAAADGGEFARACKDDQTRDNFSVSADSPLRDEVVNVGSTLAGTLSFSETLSLKSTTAMRRIFNDRSNDGDGTGLPISGGFRGGKIDITNRLVSQEFQLNGNQLEGRLQWTAGAYGIFETTNVQTFSQGLSGTTKRPGFVFAQGRNAEENQRNALLTGSDPSLQDPGLAALIGGNLDFIPKPVIGGALGTGLGECIRVPGDMDSDVAESCLRSFQSARSGNDIKNDSQSLALYAEATYSATDKLTLGAGLRFTNERKRSFRFGRLLGVERFAMRSDPTTQINGLDGDPTNGGRFINEALFSNNGTFTAFDFSERFGGYTPRLTAQYRFTPGLSAYATFSEGFVPARSDGRTFLGPGGPFVDPEQVTQYEAGINSRWFGGKFTLNGAVYTNLYRKIQRTVTTNDDTGATVSVTQNSGKAVINGGEVDISLMPLPRLVLTSSVAVRAGRYQEFDAPPNAPSFVDARLPGVTPLSMDFAVNYSLPVASFGDLRTRFNWRHDAQTGSIVADPSFSRIPKHGTLGGMLSFDLKDGVTSVSLFGSNLLDREYFVNVVDFSGSNGTAQFFFAPPRQYGLEVRRKF
jgi:outer membrane receptor protein involved in Fe transport